MVVRGGELEDAQNGKRKEDIDKQSDAKRIGMLYILTGMPGSGFQSRSDK